MSLIKVNFESETKNNLTTEAAAELLQLTFENLLRGYTSLDEAKDAVDLAFNASEQFGIVQQEVSGIFSAGSILLDGIVTLGHHGYLHSQPHILAESYGAEPSNDPSIIKLQIDTNDVPMFIVCALQSKFF